MRYGNARTAVQAVQHVWITDEVLALAFRRFQQLSLAHRRHGSNVPGPLEARRRQAKRKMGMEAITSSQVPHSGFGSLFGLGRPRPPPDFEKGWRWEAPMEVPIHVEPVSRQLPYEYYKGHDYQNPNETRPVAHRIPNPDTGQAYDDFMSLPPDPVSVSRSTFKSFLEPINGNKRLEVKDIQPVVAFLDSAANEPDAQLTLRLVRWLGQWTEVAGEIWDTIAESIRHRAKHLEMSTKEITSIWMHLLYRRKDGLETMRHFAEIPTEAQNVHLDVTNLILQTSPDKKERIAKIDSWLKLVYPGRSAGKPSDTWSHLYEQLAPHFQPSDFPEHFGGMPRERLAWTLLQHWVPVFTRQTFDTVTIGTTKDTATHPRKFHPSVVAGGRKRFRAVEESATPVDWESIQQLFVERNTQGESYVLNSLLHILDWQRIPCHRLHAEIFFIYLTTQSSSAMNNLFLDFIYRPKRSPGWVYPQLATKLAKHFVASGHTSYAFMIFIAVPTIPLRECYDLPVKLIEDGRTHGDNVWQVLLRSTAEDKVEVKLRTHQHNNLAPKNVEMVHEVAYAWACSPHINARMAYRRVWQCYRYLKDKKAPIFPLMSRAMVRAGITRAISENGRLSKEQVKYAVGVVQQIEGEQIAAQLDELVYECWTVVKAARGYTPGMLQDQTGYTTRSRKIWQIPEDVRSPTTGRDRARSVESPAVDSQGSCESTTTADGFVEPKGRGALDEVSDFLGHYRPDSTLVERTRDDERSEGTSYLDPTFAPTTVVAEPCTSPDVQPTAPSKTVKRSSYTPFSAPHG